MAFTRAAFSLFFSLPLDSIDWDNLAWSKVKRIQLPLEFATPDTCKRLTQQGVSLTVRVNERNLSDMAQVAVDCHAVRKHVALDGVIIGNEPEHPYDLRYGSPTWGQDRAYQHNAQIEAAIAMLRPMGIPVISPGWTSRVKDYNWEEGLYPGEQTWLEITRTQYNRCDANGFHVYTYDGTPYDIDERMRRLFHTEQARRHRPLWVNEIGIGSGDELHRVRTYLHIASLLMTTNRNSVWYRSGERVEGLTPFVANGDPNGQWDASYLIRSPESYALIRRFMDGENF